MKSRSLALGLTALALPLLPLATFAASTDSRWPAAEQAAALIRQNELAPAEALLSPLTGADSKDAAAFFQLGNLRSKQRRADDAVSAYEHALRLDGTRPEYFSSYAIALSAKLPGANFMVQAMLAPKMKNAFAKSVALDARHLPGLIGLARYHSNAPEIAGGSLEKAKEFARRVKDGDPFVGALELGKIAERVEDFAAALEHFEDASRLKPENAAAHFSAGRMLAKLAQTDAARRRFETAVQLDPKREAAKKALAELPASAATK